MDLPEVGDSLEANEPFGSVESVKAVSEIFAPVTGEIIEVNSKLLDNPETINESPHQQAWMVKIRIINPDELRLLLSSDEYEEYLEEQTES